MRTMLAGGVLVCAVTGCSAATPSPVATTVAAADGAAGARHHEGAPAQDAAVSQASAGTARDDGARATGGAWIGAAGASDLMLAGTRDTQLGVWIDVPGLRGTARAPAAVALVVDTSGSMDGAKIEHARVAAQAFVDGLSDGDIVSLTSFADTAQERVAPVVLGPATRPAILRAIAALMPSGSTNMFDGLRVAERRVVEAPPTHPVRRVVLVSDGQANIGPSSPDVLGSIARRGAEHGVQVTSLGVGADYDERTLNALAFASSGRLYHLNDAREMSAIMERERSLLQATAATDTFVEIVPAPGVQLLAVESEHVERTSDGALRVRLGTMFGGQHREMLVNLRVDVPTAGSHPLASVRLHFRDPADGNVERVQEVVARFDVTDDPRAVVGHANERTKTIAAVLDAGKAALVAAQDVNAGDFHAAEQKLAAAEARLRAAAAAASSNKEKERAIDAAARVATARGAARAARAAPAAARMDALEINGAGMGVLGR